MSSILWAISVFLLPIQALEAHTLLRISPAASQMMLGLATPALQEQKKTDPDEGQGNEAVEEDLLIQRSKSSDPKAQTPIAPETREKPVQAAEVTRDLLQDNVTPTAEKATTEKGLFQFEKKPDDQVEQDPLLNTISNEHQSDPEPKKKKKKKDQ